MAGKDNRSGKKQATVYGSQPTPGKTFSPGRKKITPGKIVRDEADPEWRQWFIEVEQRRQDHKERQKKFWRTVEVQKDSAVEKISRAVAEPVKLSKSVKKALPERIIHLSAAYSLITSLWARAVGEEIAVESALYSFKAGVVTMTIFSSTLLQEIRQFHATAILADLRDIWTLDTPLLGIKYRIGERKEERPGEE